jgi:phage tail sheath protein FI
MPVSLTYPGVYVQEVQSSVHTITGVPTSVAAFVGYAARGLVDTPVHVNSWADYERMFGGLDPTSPMSYAAFLFFLNGGASAEIVRAGATDGSAAAASIALSADVTLVASSPGTWGNALQVTVDTSMLMDTKTRFNLTITDTGSGATENYTGLSLAAPGITAALLPSQLMHVDPTSALTKIPAAGTYTVPGAPAADPPADPPPDPPAKAPAGGGKGVDVDLGKLAVPGDQAAKTGIYALVKADIFNMLCLPGNWDGTYPAQVLQEAAAFCAQQRAMLIVDPPTAWAQAPPPLSFETVVGSAAVGGPSLANVATYYPNLLLTDPVTQATQQRGPCGAVAGLWASTDNARGVWKAPAGTAAAITGISDLSVHIDDGESGVLNPIAVNCLRTLPLVGPVSWGARTAAGSDEQGSQWKYIPVRRTALYIEESLRRGTQWAVFEPNDEPLWSSIRLNVGAFMNSLFKQGAFQGSTPADAYLVQCDADNNPQTSINLGILNITVGFQPLVPAEFVIIQIEQLAGQLPG